MSRLGTWLARQVRRAMMPVRICGGGQHASTTVVVPPPSDHACGRESGCTMLDLGDVMALFGLCDGGGGRCAHRAAGGGLHAGVCCRCDGGDQRIAPYLRPAPRGHRPQPHTSPTSCVRRRVADVWIAASNAALMLRYQPNPWMCLPSARTAHGATSSVRHL